MIRRGWPRSPIFLVSAALAMMGAIGLIHLSAERAIRERPNYSQIENGLYMGGYVAKPPRGTQAVLNLCETKDLYQCDVQRWEPIRDGEPAPTLEWLRQMVEFVRTERAGGRTVYVHCLAGASRSGMVVVAHLMMKHNWSRDEALAFVRTRRPITRPNPWFMVLLGEWERALTGAVNDNKSDR